MQSSNENPTFEAYWKTPMGPEAAFLVSGMVRA